MWLMGFRVHTLLHGLLLRTLKLRANKKLLIFENFQLKFVFFKKATNIDEIFTVTFYTYYIL